MSETEKTENSQKIVLEEDEELQIHVQEHELKVELLKGHAEIFGYELQAEKPCIFSKGANFSIFTFHGCSLKIEGQSYEATKSDQNPIIMYLQMHAALEKMRLKADKNDNERGPVTMIVGPTDSGKSTLCQLLLNYALRMGRKPVYVDLDVGQSSISIPGTLGAALIESQISPQYGYDQCAPLIFHFGQNAPAKNLALFNNLVAKLGEVLRDQLKSNRKAEASGMIINTCGWIKQQGYDHIKHIAQAFEVDLIIVLDESKLYNDLLRDIPSFVQVQWLPRSLGVQTRNRAIRMESRFQKIHQYFYGIQNNLQPLTLELKFSSVKIFRINSNLQVSTMIPRESLTDHLLAVSFAQDPQDLVQSSVAGFVCVTKVDMDTQKLTVLSPQTLPDCIFVFSDVKMSSGVEKI